MDQNEQKIKYFLYARKSSESEDKQVASIDAQIDELTKLAKDSNLEIVEVLQESKSAKAPGRPVYNEMMMRINNGEANGILCWKLNRLARNPVDGGQISWMIQQSIIKQIFTYGRSYYPSDNVIVMAVELGMANQFIRDLSVDTKRGLRAKAERGWYPTYTALGYKSNPLKIKGEKEVIIDEERFHLTRKMFDLMLTGRHSVSNILKTATNDWGLRNKRNKKVSISTIYRIFSDPFYYGLFEYPKGSGNWHNGKHQAMITNEEFNKIQVLLGKGTMKQHPKTKEFAYTGLIHCGECGGAITAENKVKRQKNGNIHFYTYYHCTKRKNPNCSQKTVRIEGLEEQILQKLNEIKIPDGFTEWAIEVLKEESKTEEQTHTRIVSNHQKAYNLIIKKIDGLIEMRANNEITIEEFTPRKSELNKEKTRLIELLKDQDQQIDDWLNKAEQLFDFAKSAKTKFENSSLKEKGNILYQLGSNLSLLDGKLSISLQKPLVHVENMVNIMSTDSGRLEPLNFSEYKQKTRAFDSRFPMLLGRADDVRTILLYHTP
jgi:site-specific DNA recombinase